MKPLSETLKELGIAFTFPIKITDTNGNRTYFENSGGYWHKREYNSDGKETYFKNSNGFWIKREYDADGNITYYEDHNGSRQGTPRSESCDGKVVEIDGQKYELKLKAQ